MDRTLVQNVARLVGIVFLLVGIAGFIPGVTTNLYDGLEFAGNDGTAELLGIFQVSVLHNIVHLLFGLAGLALAATPSGARTYLIGGGAIYLALALLGIIGGGDWIPVERRRQLAAPAARRRDDRPRRADHARAQGRLDRLARTGSGSAEGRLPEPPFGLFD